MAIARRKAPYRTRLTGRLALFIPQGYLTRRSRVFPARQHVLNANDALISGQCIFPKPIASALTPQMSHVSRIHTPCGVSPARSGGIRRVLPCERMTKRAGAIRSVRHKSLISARNLQSGQDFGRFLFRSGRARPHMTGSQANSPGDSSRPAPHVPVLAAEAIDALAVAPGGLYIDGTFGAGGYTRLLLEQGGTVLALDRDPSAIASGAALVEAKRRPADPGPDPFFADGNRGARARTRSRRRDRARHRRVLHAVRPAGARLFLPLRRPARHADGEGRPQRRRYRQRTRRGAAGQPALSLWRGAGLAAHRARHRRRARQGADHDDGGAGAISSPAPIPASRRTSIRRRARSRRCASR